MPLVIDKQKIETWRKQAFDYWSKCRVCPTGNDIVNYVVEAIGNETGTYPVPEDVAELLGITLEDEG